MTFDEEVLAVLEAERAAGSGRLRGWLKAQGAWFWDQACDTEDAALRERYLRLRTAIQTLLFPPGVAPEPPSDEAARDAAQSAAAQPEDAGFAPAGPGEAPGAAGPPEAGTPHGTGDHEQPTEAADGADEAPPPLPPLTAEEAAAEALGRLWDQMLTGETTAGYAKAIERADPRSPEPDAPATARARRAWIRIHLVSLRLPADTAAEVGAAARRAAAGGSAEADGVQPGEYLIPPLPVVGYPGVDIGYEPAGLLDGEPGSAEVARLLRILRQVSWLAEHDPTARVGFGIADPSATLQPFTEYRLGIYRNHVDNKLAAPPESAGDSLTRLDELIRGVVPVPLPAADSWWRARVKESELALNQMLGESVVMPQPGSPYKQLLHQGIVGGKHPDIAVGVAEAPGTASGTVAWALLARVGDGKGRVVYVGGE